MNPYKQISFVILKESNLPFFLLKHQKWFSERSGGNSMADVVKSRYLQASSFFVPKAKLIIDYHESTRSYQMLFTEDIINKEEKLPNY